MNSTSELAVTLSAELLEQLKAEAEILGLPVEWLVASLVADTIDARRSGSPRRIDPIRDVAARLPAHRRGERGPAPPGFIPSASRGSRGPGRRGRISVAGSSAR